MTTQRKISIPKLAAQLLLVIVLVPLLPLLLGRRRNWWEARLFASISILGYVISRALVARRHPDLLGERARILQHADAKSWDKILAPLVGLGSGFVPLVAGLDARFGWSRPFNRPAKALSLVSVVAGYALGAYALIENRFFSGMVRIQRERDHHVVSTGPYRWLRHPGYASALLTYLSTPVLLDSWWAFVPAVLWALVLLVRTYLEDRTLQEELPGYREYAGRVRYRLLPGIW